MNRTIKDATVRRYHYDSHDQLRQHLSDFVTAYNFARRLKTLKGLTPYEFICKRWTLEPERFRPDLNTWFGQVSGRARVFGKFRRAWHYAGAVPGASARSVAAQPPPEAARWPGRGRAAGSLRPS
jgi:hypothetical protein